MTLNEVIKGDVLMLFNAQGKSFGGATNHTLSISPEYTEVMCKDCGETPWKKLSKINWQITTENLYVSDEYEDFLTKALNDTEFTIIFGASNWVPVGLEKAGTNGASIDNWSVDANGVVYTGKVKISSLTLNASSGDNATYSVTLDGVGNFTPYSA